MTKIGPKIVIYRTFRCLFHYHISDQEKIATS